MCVLRVDLGSRAGQKTKEVTSYAKKIWILFTKPAEKGLNGTSKVMMKLDSTSESTEGHSLQGTPPPIIHGEGKQKIGKFAKEMSSKNVQMKTAENQPNSLLVSHT